MRAPPERCRNVRRIRSAALAAGLLAAVLGGPAGGQVVINEFMAINDGVLTNALGQTADWIELYNTSNSAVNLAGWRLTDDAARPSKWVFPSWTIPAQGYALVWANNSSLAVTQGELHASFQLSGNGEYLGLYRPNGTVASEYRPAFPAQTANVSFGLRPDVTTVPLVDSNTTVRLLIPTNGALGAAWTTTSFDDSAWARVAQPIGYESSPSNYAGLIRTTVPVRTLRAYLRMPFVVDDPAQVDEFLLRLQFDDGVVIHLNGTVLESDNAPADAVWNSLALGPRDPGDAVAWTEFDLSGRRDLLVAGTNVLAVHVLNIESHPLAFSDLLLGCEFELRRYRPNTAGEWRFFSLPTPGARNVLGESDAQPPVAFTPARGFYDQPLTVTLSSPVENAVIRYTLDSTLPDATNGLVYGAPLMVSSTTVVRARAFKPNFEPSRVQTHTYAFLSDIISNPVMRTIVTLNPTYGPQMRDSLLAAPAFFFTVPGGIDKVAERAASVEFFETGGAPGFQIDCGAKRYGQGSLVKYPKNSLRMYFRTRYGAGRLEYPVFPENPYGLPPAAEFDQLNLRCSQDGYEGIGAQVRTAWFDDVQLAMGHMGLHDRMAHAYINGVYEGLFTLRESPKEPHFEIYMGGNETNYSYRSETTPSPTWQTVLGLKTNLTELRRYVDETNLHDYMTLNFWGANSDWQGGHNWTACSPRRPDEGGFQFYSWDQDYTLLSTTLSNLNQNVPDGVFDALMIDPESRLRFADRVYRHCFNDGVLTPSNAWALLQYRADQARLPVVAESARWHNHLYPDLWSNNIEGIRAFFDARTPILIQQLRDKGWYPTLDPPVFSQHGGAVAPGFLLTMSASNTIFYTLDGRDPRTPGSGAPAGDVYAGPIPITLATTVKARAQAGGEWSALAEAFFAPEAEVSLAVSEVMYHPRNPPPGVTNGAGGATSFTAQDYEFIELRNTGDAVAGLTGVRFAEGITFDFEAGAVRSLDPGAYVLVVANFEAFQTRYTNWPALNIAGEYQRYFHFPVKTLSDGGEEVRVADGLGRTLVRFSYNDSRGWPDAADGAGHSLVPFVFDDQTDALDYGGNWRASAFVDGSPGLPDPEPARDVVLNEVVAHTDYADPARPEYDSNDWLELFNPGTSTVSLAGWTLSDDGDVLDKWAIPTGTTLAPGAWIVFDEVSGFHNPITNGFGLNKAGETVFLSHLPGGGRDRVVDAVRFKGQENDWSLGRYRDGGDYWYALTPRTAGVANAAPTSGVCIGEFHYHPATTGDEALVEFVELHNAQCVTAALWNADGAWRLDGGVSYTFPAGVTLAPNERAVVVGFDPVSNASARAAFLAAYGLTNGQARLYGPYDGQLDNRGERLALEKPLAPDQPEDPLVWVIVDEIIYFDRAPWPVAADGTGRSLARAEPVVSGRDPANWYAAWPPTPGLSPGRIVLAAPEGEAVVFAQNDEPLRAVLDGSLVDGSSPQVAFSLGDSLISTDGTEPFTGTLRLPAAGRYALRAELTDAAGVWTSRTAWVTALALSNAVVTAVDDVSASVAGALEGAVAADVRLHWGPVDGGTSTTGWASFADLGTVSNAPVTAVIGSLLPGRTYALRFSATAGGRTGWSPASTLFATLSYAAWPYSTTLRFPGYTDGETLRDFPVLVRLGTNLAGFTYSQCGGSWASLRFADEAGLTPLAYEVDVWDTNGESAVWVRVPALTNGTAIRACWGLAGMTNPSPLAARGAVWREDDEAVWHWQDDLRDSTWRGREAINGGSTPTPGMVGAGRAFDGVDDALDPSLSAAWYAANLSALTVSLWVNPAMPPRDYGTPWGSGELYLGMNTSPRVLTWTARVGGVERQGPAYATGVWQMVSLVLSNGAAYLQKNDEEPVALESYTPFTPTNAPVLGRLAEGGRPFEGVLDEVRMSRAARSAVWLRAAYRTVAQPPGFMTYGPVESAEMLDADGDGMPDAWERLHFGDTARDGDGDWDGDGASDWEEHVAGTDPTNAASNFRLTIAGATNAVVVGFQAVLGEPGSEGQIRFYTVEKATGLVETTWWGLPGYTNMQGVQGDVRVTNPVMPGASFYRGQVWLGPAP